MTIYVLVVALVSATGGMLFGFDIGVVGGVEVRAAAGAPAAVLLAVAAGLGKPPARPARPSSCPCRCRPWPPFSRSFFPR